LEYEIRKILAPGEEAKFFLNPDDGLWFGGVNKNKHGKITPIDLNYLDTKYVNHLNRMMNSPPNK